MHFLRMKEQKEQIQSAFELKPPGKTHGAPHLRNGFQQLLRMHREDELHRFRPGRTNGHAAVNFFAKGYEALEEGKITDFIAQSTAYADVTADVLNPEDISDEEIQKALDKLVAQARSEAMDANNLDDKPESEHGDGNDDEIVGGMDYSDDDDEEDSAQQGA
jgi:hypothetical protein